MTLSAGVLAFTPVTAATVFLSGVYPGITGETTSGNVVVALVHGEYVITPVTWSFVAICVKVIEVFFGEAACLPLLYT